MRIRVLESDRLDTGAITRFLESRGHRVQSTDRPGEATNSDGKSWDGRSAESDDPRGELLLVPEDRLEGADDPDAPARWARASRVIAVVADPPGPEAFRQWPSRVEDWTLIDGPPMEARLDWILHGGKGSRIAAVSEEPIAEFGLFALRSRELQPILQRAVKTLRDALRVPFVAYLDRRSGEARLCLQAGVGWRPGLVGHATVEDDPDTALGYALRARTAVRVPSYETVHRRWTPSPLEARHEVVSALVVPVESAEGPSGVLLAADPDARSFGEAETRAAQRIANILGESIARRRTEQELRKKEARASAVLNNTVEGIITIDTGGVIQSFNRAAEQIFGYDSEEVLGENVSMLMPDPYREEHDDYIERYLETGEPRIIGIGREVKGLRKDGSEFPMQLSVSEVKVEDEHLFTGLVRDITERRRLEREIISISEEERQRIGQDLHDGLGQTLSAIALFADTIADDLEREGSDRAEEVDRIASLIREADQEARQLARGLVPVDTGGEGLPAALERLAEHLDEIHEAQIHYQLHGFAGEALSDAAAANHLYRIAQEAATNALRHGDAERIELTLSGSDQYVRLQIRDDGRGFDPKSVHAEGLGLRTMEYRARLMGAELSINSVREKGTTVTCTLGPDGGGAPDSAPARGADDRSRGGCPV